MIISTVLRNVPKPTRAIPDVNTFLKVIGRNCSEYEPIFDNNWDNLFNWKSTTLKEKGLPIQQRKYILLQVDHFKNGLPMREFKKGKKSFFGGERHQKENRAKHRIQERLKQRQENEDEDD